MGCAYFFHSTVNSLGPVSPDMLTQSNFLTYHLHTFLFAGSGKTPGLHFALQFCCWCKEGVWLVAQCCHWCFGQHSHPRAFSLSPPLDLSYDFWHAVSSRYYPRSQACLWWLMSSNSPGTACLVPTKVLLREESCFYSLLCCCSLVQSCPTLCNPMDYSMPGSPVLHYLLEFAQIHVHWVGDGQESLGASVYGVTKS